MKKLLFGLLISMGLASCRDINEPIDYTGRELKYTLHQSSEFDYTGILTIREYPNKEIELDIQLIWEGSRNASINFPAHLHFGSYDTPDAPIAVMLNPVNSMSLRSATRIEELSDGSRLDFESFQNFDGHVKVHLASEGPDYKVILVAGNVGSNFNSELGFDPSKIAICDKGY
ncbi:hypothetical protein [Algoriphagus boritolerans]|uniref:CHRD domain-containing protein n=1 Tax=Algoriphagus boritolerans DSM 17298 = JCM 18970 TaxID=1120964 RepID=A0A1H5Y6I1_9BACT|nr:hypothetical protein [Algoriphagus boritolerans]SEG19126.1 hypothetical protein SAMN03080598_02822 [Algoriphagus boritolerans DSM 17298 = JCM 18970]